VKKQENNIPTTCFKEGKKPLPGMEKIQEKIGSIPFSTPKITICFR